MSQGSPASPPPDILLHALGEAARDPASCRYGPVTGDNALRQAAVDEIKHVYGAEVDVNMEDVAITAGCNMAFTAAIMTLADAGDEVIVTVPW
jgi:aspartate/methionine/tyrosine aminotransferase